MRWRLLTCAPQIVQPDCDGLRSAATMITGKPAGESNVHASSRRSGPWTALGTTRSRASSVRCYEQQVRMPSSILVLTCLYESRGCASYIAVSVSLFSEYHRHVLSEYIAFCVSGQSEDFCRITGVVACLVQLLEDDVVPVYMASAGTPSGMFWNTTSIQLCRTTSTCQCSGSVLLFTTQDFRDMMVVSVCPKTFVTCSWCNICEGRSVIGHYVRTGVFFRFPGSAG